MSEEQGNETESRKPFVCTRCRRPGPCRVDVISGTTVITCLDCGQEHHSINTKETDVDRSQTTWVTLVDSDEQRSRVLAADVGAHTLLLCDGELQILDAGVYLEQNDDGVWVLKDNRVSRAPNSGKSMFEQILDNPHPFTNLNAPNGM